MQRGFSLVELSIVLVILGLLTGGILAGQSLIRAAEMRTSITDYQNYVAAAQTFRDKYFFFGGDIPNATRFWGTAGGTGSDDTCRATVTTDGTTCNGDGNGEILGPNSATPAAAYNERGRFWQHMSRSGLIAGNYTGAYSSASANGYEAGVNVPAARAASGAFWYATYFAPSTGTATNFATSGGNILRITGSNSVFTTEECWSIDKKLDDGLPGSGRMMAFKGDASYPVTTAANVSPPGDAGATYNFANTSRICNPWMFF